MLPVIQHMGTGSVEKVIQAPLAEAYQKAHAAEQRKADRKAFINKLILGAGRLPATLFTGLLKSGAAEEEWIGVDLDGTLARYDGWKGPENIGIPIPKMVEKVKTAIGNGLHVKIFTARVAGDTSGIARRAIRTWCRLHLGLELPITCVKDRFCKEIWDDRARRVKRNVGRFTKIGSAGSQVQSLLRAISNKPLRS